MDVFWEEYKDKLESAVWRKYYVEHIAPHAQENVMEENDYEDKYAPMPIHQTVDISWKIFCLAVSAIISCIVSLYFIFRR